MKKKTTTYELPSWVTEKFPAPRKVAELHYNPSLKVAEVLINGKLYEPGEDEKVIVQGELLDVYESFHNNKTVTLTLHSSLEKLKGYHSLGELGGAYRKNKKDKYSTALIGMSDYEHIEILQEEYDLFRSSYAPKYLQNPKNFFNAYQFINNHPALYVFPDPKNDKETFIGWATNSGASSLRWYVTRKGFFMEAGPYHRSGTYYLDTNLIVSEAKSFESALIRMAKKLNKFYNLDGTAKP